MKIIANKSSLAFIISLVGGAFFIVFWVVVTVNKPDGWGICLAISVISVCAAVYGIVHELLQPHILIKADDKNLYVYHKRHWKTIPFTDISAVDFDNAQSGQMILNFGCLKITTNYETIWIENVKDVKRVALSITAIIHEHNGGYQ